MAAYSVGAGGGAAAAAAAGLDGDGGSPALEQKFLELRQRAEVGVSMGAYALVPIMMPCVRACVEFAFECWRGS